MLQRASWKFILAVKMRLALGKKEFMCLVVLENKNKGDSKRTWQTINELTSRKIRENDSDFFESEQVISNKPQWAVGQV